MSDQPNLDSEEQKTAARLREEHAAFHLQQREEQAADIDRLEAEVQEKQAEVRHLRAVNAVLEYLPELTLTKFADKEFAAVEAVRGSRKPIIRGDGTVDRDAMVAAVDDLVTLMPWLVKPLDLGVPDAPQGPSGAPCGSGRRYSSAPRDYATLRRLYPAAYPND